MKTFLLSSIALSSFILCSSQAIAQELTPSRHLQSGPFENGDTRLLQQGDLVQPKRIQTPVNLQVATHFCTDATGKKLAIQKVTEFNCRGLIAKTGTKINQFRRTGFWGIKKITVPAK